MSTTSAASLTAVFISGQRCTPTDGARQKRFRRPSKVVNDRRQLAACHTRMFLGEGGLNLELAWAKIAKNVIVKLPNVFPISFVFIL